MSRADYPSTRHWARAWLAGDEDQSLVHDIIYCLEHDRVGYTGIADLVMNKDHRERLLGWAREAADLRVEMLSRIAGETRQ